MEESSSLNLEEICARLGIQPEAVAELARDARRYYAKFERQKRTGGVRVISASTGRLKWLQRTFLDGVLSRFAMPPHVQGCVKGRSARSNAALHTGKDVVINVDLADFFGSVSLNMVVQLLINYFQFDEEAAEIFANVLVLDGVLPQGAPTSPALANIAALKLDEDLRAIVGDAGVYSRYVDDITISGGTHLVECLPKIYTAINRRGFNPNERKTKILRRHTRQTVTGLVVNEQATVQKGVLRDLRQQLYFCKRWGIKEHCESIGTTPGKFINKMHGLIGYVATMRPELAEEFNLALNELVVDLEESDEEVNLRLLKRMIDRELVAKFRYNREKIVAAPVSITLDLDDNLSVRVFQLKPTQGWKVFEICLIERLAEARLESS